MFRTYAAATLLSAALLTGSALAQTPPAPKTDTPAASTSSTPSSTQSHQGMWRASKLVGVNVYNDKNESLGSINDLVMDNSGSIKNVIIGVGGFLGVGERYISVSFDKLKWSNEPVKTAAAPPAGGMDSQRTGTVGSTSTTPPSPTASSTTAKSSADAWYPDHAILNATKDEVKSMPEFKY